MNSPMSVYSQTVHLYETDMAIKNDCQFFTLLWDENLYDHLRIHMIPEEKALRNKGSISI